MYNKKQKLKSLKMSFTTQKRKLTIKECQTDSKIFFPQKYLPSVEDLNELFRDITNMTDEEHFQRILKFEGFIYRNVKESNIKKQSKDKYLNILCYSKWKIRSIYYRFHYEAVAIRNNEIQIEAIIQRSDNEDLIEN